MNPEKVKAALEALMNDDGEAAKAILTELIASAASDGESVETETETDPAEALAGDGAPPTNPAEDEAEAETAKLHKAAADKLIKLSGKSTIGEAVADYEAFLASEKSRKEAQAKLDADERKGLVKTLVELQAEVPASAYTDPEEGTLCERLAKEPLDSLRSRTQALAKAKGRHVTLARAPESTGDTTPTTAAGKRVPLTKLEREYIEREGITEEEFYALAAKKIKANHR